MYIPFFYINSVVVVGNTKRDSFLLPCRFFQVGTTFLTDDRLLRQRLLLLQCFQMAQIGAE